MEKLFQELIELGKTKKFNGEIDYGANITSESLSEVQKLVGTSEETKEIIEKHLEDASHIHYTLLAMVISNHLLDQATPREPKPVIPFEEFEEETDTSPQILKACRSMRLLVNLIMRSPEFASRISSDVVELLETIVVAKWSSLETLCILTKTAAAGAHLEFQKSPRYSHLLEGILKFSKFDLFARGPLMGFLISYFSILLEKDYAFVASAYADMSSESLVELLDFVRVILEKNAKDSGDSEGQKLKIHSNNLLFVLNLLELMTVDYSAFLRARAEREPNTVQEKLNATVEMLYMLVESVAEMCSNPEMSTYLTDKSTVINAVVDVLDSILHAEALFADFRAEKPVDWPNDPNEGAEDDRELEDIGGGISIKLGIPGLTFMGDKETFSYRIPEKIEEEKRYEATQRMYSDRPKQPPPPKVQRVQTSPSLALLSLTVFQSYCKLNDDVAKIGELKVACLKAITNLSSLSAENKLATLQNGRNGLLSVLQCTSRRPAYFMESFVMRNQCIFCVRVLTDNCQRNKQVILNLGHSTQQIIDRKRLLAEFGIDEDDVKEAEPPVSKEPNIRNPMMLVPKGAESEEEEGPST